MKVLKFVSKREKQIAVANHETVDVLSEAFKKGYIRETIIITQMSDGRIGIMGNLVPKEKAIAMLKHAIRNADDIDEIVE